MDQWWCFVVHRPLKLCSIRETEEFFNYLISKEFAAFEMNLRWQIHLRSLQFHIWLFQMRHLIVFVVLVGIAHCDVVHLQHYPAVPVVQYHQPYHQPYVPVHNAYYSAPLRSAVVNPYVGAYHAVPAYSRQVSNWYAPPAYVLFNKYIHFSLRCLEIRNISLSYELRFKPVGNM